MHSEKTTRLWSSRYCYSKYNNCGSHGIWSVSTQIMYHTDRLTSNYVFSELGMLQHCRDIARFSGQQFLDYCKIITEALLRGRVVVVAVACSALFSPDILKKQNISNRSLCKINLNFLHDIVVKIKIEIWRGNITHKPGIRGNINIWIFFFFSKWHV